MSDEVISKQNELIERLEKLHRSSAIINRVAIDIFLRPMGLCETDLTYINVEQREAIRCVSALYEKIECLIRAAELEVNRFRATARETQRAADSGSQGSTGQEP